jgi:hypothetical protein
MGVAVYFPFCEAGDWGNTFQISLASRNMGGNFLPRNDCLGVVFYGYAVKNNTQTNTTLRRRRISIATPWLLGFAA